MSIIHTEEAHVSGHSPNAKKVSVTRLESAGYENGSRMRPLEDLEGNDLEMT